MCRIQGTQFLLLLLLLSCWSPCLLLQPVTGSAPSRREAMFGLLGAALGVGVTTAYYKGAPQELQSAAVTLHTLCGVCCCGTPHKPLNSNASWNQFWQQRLIVPGCLAAVAVMFVST